MDDLLSGTSKFDVAVLSGSSIDIGLYLCKQSLSIPTILYSNYRRVSYLDAALGNPMNPSYIPVDDFTALGSRMTFIERLENTYALVKMQNVIATMFGPVEILIQEHFKLDEKPSLWTLLHDIDVGFFNDVVGYEGVQPVNPGSLNIGGMHLHAPGQLPVDIQEWLDGAKDGAILIAYGTVQ